MKKLLTSLIILTLIVSSFSFVAFADTTTTVEVNSWDTLTSALAAAPMDGTEYTIKFTKSFTNGISSSTSTTQKYLDAPAGANVVIDLNSYTFTVKGRLYFGGTITLTNGNYVYASTKSDYYAMFVGHGTVTGNLTLNNINITANSAGVKGISMTNKDSCENTLTLTDVNIESSGIAIYNTGTKNTVTVKSGNYTTAHANGSVVKFQAGQNNVHGGTFTNTAAIPATYKLYNTDRDEANSSSGATNLKRTFYYGGTYQIDLSIAVGNIIASGRYCVKTGENKYQILEGVKGAAKIDNYYTTTSTYYDGTHFETLALAVNDVKEGQAITLLANNTEAVEINKPVTITKNGFTANVTAGEGYVLKDTGTAYIVEEAPSEVTVAQNITASYDNGKGTGTKTSRFFADINTLDVAEAGFEVSATFGGVKYTWEIALSEVYKEVVANDVTYNATNYILTGALGDVPADFEDEFEVKVYTKNYEGIKSYR